MPATPDPLKTYLIPNTEYPDAYDAWLYNEGNWQLHSKYQERRNPFPKYLSFYNNLMPKCFREYLEGWDIGYSGLQYNPPMPPFSEEKWQGYYDGRSTFQGTETYKPIAYYQDSDAIAKYGIKDVRKDFSDIYPSIIEQYASDNGQPLGRLDEIVDVYVPPTGKYWEDTDNIVEDLVTGNRVNNKVPFMIIPTLIDPISTNLLTLIRSNQLHIATSSTTSYSDDKFVPFTVSLQDNISYSANLGIKIRNFPSPLANIGSNHFVETEFKIKVFLETYENNTWINVENVATLLYSVKDTFRENLYGFTKMVTGGIDSLNASVTILNSGMYRFRCNIIHQFYYSWFNRK